jgi:hypothetical protein
LLNDKIAHKIHYNLNPLICHTKKYSQEGSNTVI